MHDDWGEVTPRWAGIRSEVIDLLGHDVHVLRAGDAADGPPRLLVHGLGGSATNWLEVIPGLARHGPVVAPDLPGFGATEPPRPRAARIEVNARFLWALARHLGLRDLVVHGNSMGATVVVLTTQLMPERIDRLVLVSPALPLGVSHTSRIDPMTVRRFAPFVVPSLGAHLLRRRYRAQPLEDFWAENLAYVHADPSRVSPEMVRLGLDNLREFETTPWRLPSFVAAATSLVTAVAGRRILQHAIDGVRSPTLVVWGDADRLVGPTVIDRVRARRQDWDVEVLDGVGHVPMIEVPERYVQTVDDWLDTTGPIRS